MRAVATVVLMLGLAQGAPAANIVTNPGFETGSFAGWVQFGNTDFTGVDTNSEHSGNFGAFFGATGSAGGIEQTLTVAPNSTYNIDFRLANDDGTPNSFEVRFDNQSVTGVVVNVPGLAYSLFHFTASTDADSTAVLSFAFRHDVAFFRLDDVCVDNARNGACAAAAQVPEPSGLALLAVGLAGLAFGRRKRARQV